MEILIRLAGPKDAALVAEFVRELAEYEKLAGECVATPALINEALFSAKPAAYCLLAFADERPAGFAVYFFNFSTFLSRRGLYLEDLFVKEAFRNQGIGRSLILRMAKIANEENCGRMEWAVLDWNKPAIAFYEGLGATIMPDWRICRLSGSALAKLA